MEICSVLAAFAAIDYNSVLRFLKDIDSDLPIIGAIGETFVLLSIHRCKVWRTFPIFSAYILWDLFSDIAGLYAQNVLQSGPYHRFYLVESSLDSLLQFCVLVEMSWSVLRPIRASLPRATPFIIGILLVLVGLLIWPLAGMAVPSSNDLQLRLIDQVQDTGAILRIILFLLMASLSQLLSIGWRDRELQIATGFGTFSIVAILVALLESHQARGDAFHWLDWVQSASYFCTLVYWMLSFSTVEQKRKEFSPQMQQILVSIGAGIHADRIALSDRNQKPVPRRKL